MCCCMLQTLKIINLLQITNCKKRGLKFSMKAFLHSHKEMYSKKRNYLFTKKGVQEVVQPRTIQCCGMDHNPAVQIPH